MSENRDPNRQLPLFTHGAEYTIPNLPTINAFGQSGARRPDANGHNHGSTVVRDRAPWVVRVIGRTVAAAAICCLAVAAFLVWGTIALFSPSGVPVPSFPSTAPGMSDVPVPGGNPPMMLPPTVEQHEPAADERAPSVTTGAVPTPPIVPAEPFAPISPGESLSPIVPVEPIGSITVEDLNRATSSNVTE